MICSAAVILTLLPWLLIGNEGAAFDSNTRFLVRELKTQNSLYVLVFIHSIDNVGGYFRNSQQKGDKVFCQTDAAS